MPRTAAYIALAYLLATAASAQHPTPVGGDAGLPAATSRPAATLEHAWSAVEPEFPDEQGRALRRRSREGASPTLAAKSQEPSHSWTRTLGALAGVVGLIVLLAWGYRAMAGGNLSLLGKVRRPGLIEVISRAPLSARQSLCLVRVGPRLLLIGQSQESLRALDVIDDADLAAKLAGEAARKWPGSSAAEFHECLEREAQGYREEDELNEGSTPGGGQVARAQHGVSATIRRIRRAVAQI